MESTSGPGSKVLLPEGHKLVLHGRPLTSYS